MDRRRRLHRVDTPIQGIACTDAARSERDRTAGLSSETGAKGTASREVIETGSPDLMGVRTGDCLAGEGSPGGLRGVRGVQRDGVSA